MVAVQQSEDHESLLTIGQAAELLQVSQISLRRWTDAGRLKCYRVGRRRERRFKHEDLVAFMEGGEVLPDDGITGAARNTQAQSPIDKATVNLEGITIEYGKHLCSLYESDLGRLKMSVPFLSEGLRNGDICYIVASDYAITEITNGLRRVYDQVDEAIKQHNLIVHHGEPSVSAMYSYFEKELVHTTQSGQHMVRVLGDMAWFLDKGMTLSDLNDFESRYNNYLAHKFPVISLCQYDARRFDGSGILCALRCHEDTFSYPLSRFVGI